MGLPSDDTQMAFWTLEQMLADNRLRPSRLAEVYATRPIFGIGGTVRQFSTSIRDRQMAWYRAGLTVDADGNGALMRIAPVILPYLCQPSAALYADAAVARPGGRPADPQRPGVRLDATSRSRGHWRVTRPPTRRELRDTRIAMVDRSGALWSSTSWRRGKRSGPRRMPATTGTAAPICWRRGRPSSTS